MDPSILSKLWRKSNASRSALTEISSLSALSLIRLSITEVNLVEDNLQRNSDRYFEINLNIPRRNRWEKDPLLITVLILMNMQCLPRGKSYSVSNPRPTDSSSIQCQTQAWIIALCSPSQSKLQINKLRVDVTKQQQF